MKRIILAATIAAASLAGPGLADQYVCQTEQITGFRKGDDGYWRDTRFTNRPSFLVDIEARTVSEFGQGLLYGAERCGDGWFGPEVFACSSSIGTNKFMLSRPNRRFIHSMTFGYIFGDDVNDTPYIAIGTCVELEG